jgi:predicted enzyme related to lactoylglutathione lyase
VSIGGAEIGLLAHPPNPEQGDDQVELNFESRTPLEHVERRARDAGVTVARPTNDEGFGRQLQLRTPDGLLVKLNEIDAELIG